MDSLPVVEELKTIDKLKIPILIAAIIFICNFYLKQFLTKIVHLYFLLEHFLRKIEYRNNENNHTFIFTI